MVFRIANNGNASAAGNDYVTFRYAFSGVIRSLGMNVRTNKSDKIFYIRRIEDDYSVDVRQGGQQLRPLRFRHSWPAFAFESARTGIRVYGHNQFAAQLLGCPQIPDVPNMQQIKTAVGQDNPASCGAPLPDLLCQFGGRKNFLGGLRQISPP